MDERFVLDGHLGTDQVDQCADVVLDTVLFQVNLVCGDLSGGGLCLQNG